MPYLCNSQLNGSLHIIDYFIFAVVFLPGISQRKEELFPSSDPEDQSLLSDSETSSLGDYLSDDLSNSNHDRISSSSGR